MKVERVVIYGVVHRLITSTLGHMTISCDLPYDDEDFSTENDMIYTTDPLTCFPCLVCDEQALRRKLMRQLITPARCT